MKIILTTSLINLFKDFKFYIHFTFLKNNVCYVFPWVEV